MMQETLVPEFTITTSREYWEQKTYEEIKKTHLPRSALNAAS